MEERRFIREIAKWCGADLLAPKLELQLDSSTALAAKGIASCLEIQITFSQFPFHHDFERSNFFSIAVPVAQHSINKLAVSKAQDRTQ